MKNTAAVILAAGKSKRMKTTTPKILHPLMGKPVIDYVLAAVAETGTRDITVVIGHEKEKIYEYLSSRVKFAEQLEQLGTGHAVMMGMTTLQDFSGDLMVLAGDMPLLTGETLKKFLEMHQNEGVKVSLLTGVTEDPGKLGRVIRNEKGDVIGIVEAADATPEQLAIKEVNTGTYVFDADYLREILPKIGSNNAQGEIYLTDAIEISRKNGVRVAAMVCPDFRETFGINNRYDISIAAKVIKDKINYNHMMAGVTLYDPDNTYIEATVEIGNDTTILPGCMLMGNTRIGSNCVIGPNCRINNSTVGEGVEIRESVIVESEIGDETTVGPYAHMRPGSRIGRHGKIGNFVETKKSVIGDNSKVPHLSYVGDATIGTKVNVGAGTITCNYDGKKKHPTVLEDNVFIGSNSSLVAPLHMGEGSASGAGSVVTKDVPPHTLVVGNPARKLREV